MRNKRKMGYVFLMSLLILCCSSTTVFAADTSAEYVPQLYATIWSLVPPVVAIVLALITKEVYSSLFVVKRSPSIAFFSCAFIGP